MWEYWVRLFKGVHQPFIIPLGKGIEIDEQRTVKIEAAVAVI